MLTLTGLTGVCLLSRTLQTMALTGTVPAQVLKQQIKLMLWCPKLN
jgi:hypothetical protein